MVPDRCAACPRKCLQVLAYLESMALAEDRGPLADPRFLARGPIDEAMPPATWQHRCESRPEAA